MCLLCDVQSHLDGADTSSMDAGAPGLRSEGIGVIHFEAAFTLRGNQVSKPKIFMSCILQLGHESWGS